MERPSIVLIPRPLYTKCHSRRAVQQQTKIAWHASAAYVSMYRRHVTRAMATDSKTHETETLHLHLVQESIVLNTPPQPQRVQVHLPALADLVPSNSHLRVGSQGNRGDLQPLLASVQSLLELSDAPLQHRHPGVQLLRGNSEGVCYTCR